MENKEIREFFETFLKEQPISAVLSGQVEKNDFLKVKVRPVLSGGKVRIQIEEFRGKQAFHKNMSTGEAADYLTELMETSFKQVQAETESWSGQVLVSKKRKGFDQDQKKGRSACFYRKTFQCSDRGCLEERSFSQSQKTLYFR